MNRLRKRAESQGKYRQKRQQRLGIGFRSTNLSDDDTEEDDS